jgi:hypothetical protein
MVFLTIYLQVVTYLSRALILIQLILKFLSRLLLPESVNDLAHVDNHIYYITTSSSVANSPSVAKL